MAPANERLSTDSKRRQRGAAVWIGVAALLLLHAALALRAVAKKSVTVDELGYITNGIVYWRVGDYRFARLCHYLRARKPIATIGYSILIYRLTESDLRAALE